MRDAILFSCISLALGAIVSKRDGVRQVLVWAASALLVWWLVAK